MNPRDLIDYWRTTAEDDLQTAEALMLAKRYHHALFFCHLAIEKLLKGLIFKKTNQHALPIHDLTKLAQQANLSLTESQKEDFKEITSWNIQARYDSIKREFYKKATEQFASRWFTKTKEVVLWLNQQF